MREKSVAAGLSMILVLIGVTGLAGTAGSLENVDSNHHVHIDDSTYVPGDLIVRPGESVEWDNHDAVPHDATADNDEWQTDLLTGTGDSDTLVFEESGTWGYHCSVHPSITGTLTVNLPAETAIASHTDGDHVDGLVTLEGTAADSDGTVEYVEVRIDGGSWENTTGTTNWSYDWDTLQSHNGDSLVEVRAYDGVEHSDPTEITLTVDNPLFVDLEVTGDDVQADTGPLESQIHVTVHNRGNTDAAAFTLALEYEYKGQPRVIGEAAVEGLGPFSSRELTIPWDTLGKIGDFEVTATADPEDTTGDVDPSNNQGTIPVSILVGGFDGVDLFDP